MKREKLPDYSEQNRSREAILRAVMKQLRSPVLLAGRLSDKLEVGHDEIFLRLVEQDLESFMGIWNVMFGEIEQADDREAHLLMGKVLLLAHYLNAWDYHELFLQLEKSGQQVDLVKRSLEMEASLFSAQAILLEVASEEISQYGLERLRQLLETRTLVDFAKTLPAKTSQQYETSLFGEERVCCDKILEAVWSKSRLSDACVKLFMLLARDDKDTLRISRSQAGKIRAWEAYASLICTDCREALQELSCAIEELGSGD